MKSRIICFYMTFSVLEIHGKTNEIMFVYIYFLQGTARPVYRWPVYVQPRH